MFNRIPIAFKLLGLVSGAILVTTLVFGFVANQRASNAILEQQKQSLKGFAEARANALEDYLRSIHTDIIAVSDNLETLQAVEDYTAAWSEIDSNIHGVSEAAQEAGVTANRMRSASELLNQQSQILRQEVLNFLDEVRIA